MILSLFTVALMSSLGAYLLLNGRLERRERAVALRRLAAGPAGESRKRAPTEPILIQARDQVRGRMAARVLEHLRLKRLAENLLETAGLRWGASGLLHRSIIVFLVVFAAITVPTGNRMPGAALGGAAAAAALPFLYVRRKARTRVRDFEAQFPDCLEFISRSMRAGHAFSVALEMVHKEFGEPLATEFRRTFEEQNLGQPLEIALKRLAQRVPSMDVQFFVSAVLLQKRTGGNLAELLDKLAQLIRERFKLRARIRAISAQGLMSGRILASIPGAVGALMFLVNPQYARFFVDDPMGHQLLAGSLGLQLLGYLIIRKIVRIEV